SHALQTLSRGSFAKNAEAPIPRSPLRFGQSLQQNVLSLGTRIQSRNVGQSQFAIFPLLRPRQLNIVGDIEWIADDLRIIKLVAELLLGQSLIGMGYKETSQR